MQQYKNILSSFLILTLFACNSPVDKQHSEKSEKDQIDTNTVVRDSLSQSMEDECVRGQAEPIIQKKDYPNTTFVLQPDSLSAIETVTFDNGDRLIIRNWGCEYYVLTFRFETVQFKGDTSNLAYWYQSADILMTRMLGGLDAPINIKRGLVFLESYRLRDEKNHYKNLKLGEEIDFDGSEIRNFVTLDSIEKLSDSKYAVTLSFATGPL